MENKENDPRRFFGNWGRERSESMCMHSGSDYDLGPPGRWQTRHETRSKSYQPAMFSAVCKRRTDRRCIPTSSLICLWTVSQRFGFVRAWNRGTFLRVVQKAGEYRRKLHQSLYIGRNLRRGKESAHLAVIFSDTPISEKCKIGCRKSK